MVFCPFVRCVLSSGTRVEGDGDDGPGHDGWGGPGVVAPGVHRWELTPGVCRLGVGMSNTSVKYAQQGITQQWHLPCRERDQAAGAMFIVLAG